MSGPPLLKIKRNVWDCHLLQHDGNLKIPILYVGCLSVILRAVLLIHFIITSRLVPVSRTGVWLIGDPISDYFWKSLKIIRSFHLLFVITFWTSLDYRRTTKSKPFQYLYSIVFIWWFHWYYTCKPRPNKLISNNTMISYSKIWF